VVPNIEVHGEEAHDEVGDHSGSRARGHDGRGRGHDVEGAVEERRETMMSMGGDEADSCHA
jgi:hypothetical protein